MYLEENYHEIAETLGIGEVNARVKMNRIKEIKKILNQWKNGRAGFINLEEEYGFL
jgi:hypothetical protein